MSFERATPNSDDIRALAEKIQIQSKEIHTLVKELNSVIIGQDYMINRLLIAIMGNGHILLEGVPGLAKTLTIKTFSDAVEGKYSRIQFTPDLLPADVVGTMIYNIKDNDFSIKKGPIFANFVLADEINRAPAKVQSALLEAMQERQVTIGDETYPLAEPFLVMATQNPIEQEGTYPLPEAQVDRFMLKCVIKYPELEDERIILRNNIQSIKTKVNKVFSLDQILKSRALLEQVYMDEKIEKYILDIIFATRFPKDYGLDKLTPLISFGASPRGSINLAIASKAYAFLKGRGYVIPEDVKAIIEDVLRHRIGLTYEAEAENVTQENILEEILKSVKAP